MSKTIDVVGEIPEESISPEARDGLLDVFGAWKRG